MLEQGISQQLSAISPQDLALMAHIGADLSEWEKTRQLPMLSNDAQALRYWLLADLDEIGVAPEAFRRRRAARDKAWRALSSGWHSLSRPRPTALSQFDRTTNADASWTYAGALPSALRHLAFWGHWGVPGGMRRGTAPQAAFVLHSAVLMFSALVSSKQHAAMALCAAGLLLALRMALWLASSEESRLAFHAQAASPFELRWLNARRAAAEAARDQADLVQKATRSEPALDILAAVEAASLGGAQTPQTCFFPPTPLDALLAQRAERKAKLLADARDPQSVHARLERARLEAATQKSPPAPAGSLAPRL